jgi:uncharacterized protein YfaS (alpha-2-macroglobulin family)
VVTHLPVQDIAELQQPGLYFAVMKKAGAFKDDYDTAFFTVSDIGLHVRAYKDKLFVHTASLADGDPLANAELRVLDARGEPVFKGKTDGNGNALLDYTLDAAHVLTAARGKDVSMLPFNQPALDLSEFAVSGRGQAWFDVFAWSGRDLYRPGRNRAGLRAAARQRRQAGGDQERQGAVPVRAPQAAGRQDLRRVAHRSRRTGVFPLREGDPGRSADRQVAGRIPHRPGQQGSGAGHGPAHRGIPAGTHEAGPGQRGSAPASG